MDTPRAEKVAVVDEVRSRLDGASASVVTEYRGLTVAQLAELRKSLSAAGGDYKVFKNTLVRRAIDGSVHAPLEELLVGPTAIAFVHGEVSAVARALRDFSRVNAHLVVKGGLLDGAVLSPAQLATLADLPSREVLLGRLAGVVQAPLSQLASLLQALPRNLAYGLKALAERQGPAPEASATGGEPAAGAGTAGADAAVPEAEGEAPPEAAAPAPEDTPADGAPAAEDTATPAEDTAAPAAEDTATPAEDTAAPAPEDTATPAEDTAAPAPEDTATAAEDTAAPAAEDTATAAEDTATAAEDTPGAG